MDSVYAELWDSQQGNWKVDNTQYFHYDAKGNNDHYVARILNEETGQLEPMWKSEFAYNNAGKITQSLDYSWGPSEEEWVQEWKLELIYNDGYLHKTTEYEWDENNGEWIISWKDEYEYNNQKQLIMVMSFEWDEDSGSWLKIRRTEYGYDSMGNLILESDASCLNGIDLWKNEYKTEFEYNNNQNVSFETFFMWEVGQWNTVEGKEYTYDDSNNLIVIKELDWNGTGWFNYSLIEYDYDQSDNMVFMQVSDWNDIIQQFEPYMKSTQEYDNDYDKSSLLLPWYFTEEEDMIEPFNHMLLNLTQQVHNGSDWAYSYRINFYYSEVDIDAIHDLNTAQVCASPNPFNDELRISASDPITRVTIIDLMGNDVFDLRSGGDKEILIPTTKLPPGLYVCRLSVQGGLHTIRLIKGT